VQTDSTGGLAHTLGLLTGRGLCCLLIVGAIVWSAKALMRRSSREEQTEPPYPDPTYLSSPLPPATARDGQATADERKVALWGRNKAYVDAVLKPDGTLEFLGQDLNPANPWGAEYEYALTVESADVPRVVAALGGAEGDDVLALLRANAEQVVGGGEQRWLRSLGIEPGFWSHVGDEL
jgi:hypothetical protein